MLTLDKTLAKYGALAVRSIQNDVSRISATGKSAASVYFVIKFDGTKYTLQIRGRKFFKAIETGRGPRKSDQYQGFDVNILEYMNARGIATEKSEKERLRLAKFIAYKINKEGDSVFKAGGRQVYSDNLKLIVDGLKLVIRREFRKFVLTELKNEFNRS